MKIPLKISLTLNVALAASLLFFYFNGSNRQLKQPAAALASGTKADSPSPPADVSGAALVSPADPRPFHWHQLEAKDYRVYVKNLRGIGCPEATLRAIVSADVYGAYRVRIHELEKNISDLRASPLTNQLATLGTETALKADLQQIPDEETAMINNLLGYQPAAEVAANTRRPQPARPVVQPLALQDVDLTGLALNDDQKQAIANVRQEFLEQIGGTNQNPDDPAYLQRWQKAQPAADNLLMSFLGNQAYTEYQLKAYQRSLENQGAQQ